MSYKTILKMVLVTMGVMFVCNYAATLNPTIRRVIKGERVTPVEPVSPGSVSAI